MPPASLIYRPASYLERMQWQAMFPQVQPVEVEIGAGDGSFLAQYAGLHPERNFLGIERLLGRLKKIDRKGRRAGLDNLLAFRIEAAYFAEYLLPPAGVATVHLYFPDPWPKRKHLKNRLVQPSFAEHIQRALEPGGVIYLRTDNENYFAQMREVFGGHAGYTACDTPGELAAVTTDFEREFNAQGIPTLRAAYRKS